MFMVNKDYHFRVIRIRSPDSELPWRRSVPSECCCVLNVAVFKYASYNQRLGSLDHEFFAAKLPAEWEVNWIEILSIQWEVLCFDKFWYVQRIFNASVQRKCKYSDKALNM